MTQKVTDLPVITELGAADKLLVSDASDSLSKQISASDATKQFSGGTGILVFRLDPSNLDQLESGGTADFADGGGGGTIAQQGTSERGDVWEYTDGGGTDVTEVFLFTDAIVFPTERRDLIIEMELFDANFGTAGYFGPWFLGDDSVDFGFGHAGMGVAEWQVLLNDGTVEHDAATGVEANVFARYLIRGRKPAGAPPEVSSFMEGWDPATGSVGAPRRSGSDAAARGSVPNFGNDSTLGASWNAQTLDRIGLVFLSSGGNAPPSLVQLLDMRVYVL